VNIVGTINSGSMKAAGMREMKTANFQTKILKGRKNIW
jgi:hypothetical protein